MANLYNLLKIFLTNAVYRKIFTKGMFDKFSVKIF